MIYFKDNYATFWEDKTDDKGTTVKLSTSKKNEYNGKTTYRNSNFYAKFVGDALNVIEDLHAKDRIKISGGIEHVYNKEKKQSYLNMVVWGCEKIVANNSNNNDYNPLEDDSELPF
jgi:hypothetical protein